MKYDTSLRIGTHEISLDAPAYFIADIAANHDGDLGRAKELIWKSKEAGADCAKFQHFLADRIVSKVKRVRFRTRRSGKNPSPKSTTNIIRAATGRPN
jgi:N-acetylneuraminate synthase